MKALSSFAIAATVIIASPVAAQALSPSDFVTKAGASDLYERTSSKLVLETTKNQKIRQFAQMMITDHTKSTNDVKMAAKQAGVTPPPPALDADQSRMVAELRQARGEARDQAYVTQQKAAHQKALALHQGYAQSGTAAPLKAVAAKTAPVVQHHLEMLNGM
ncbi:MULTISPECIES: DUF4142 domain-containing protein [unclassified Sphingomonas]|uniref:DUF4142 domain-containing protein n=1 Tax=unclassified Sphingomonas TaxID=196159 RepID=UPI001D129CD6|nr:DUF4142 domain-containing protein [Sphingomonas sp. IC4-52]MCC2979997.1 DUF4142 domain-containing protein [Sphingomonas sp. IC4-52]MCD2314759.1 DUF4142 domain-containing protein [Sphingomonas sp. IC-11]